MPTNPFFNAYPTKNNEEQQLIEDLICESIATSGTDVYYLPRGSRDVFDPLYGEDPVASFTSAYIIEMYVVNTEAPVGQSEFFTKFNMEIRDSIYLDVARRSFNKYVAQPAKLIRPREGDLIWVPFLNNMYEIKFVEEEKDFHSLGTRPPYFFYYELKCEMFKFNNEIFKTGVSDIDQMGRDYAYTITLSLGTSNTAPGGVFVIGESVFQDSTGSFATVKQFDPRSNTCQIMHINGVFANNATVSGNTSGASYIISSYDRQNFSKVLEEIADNVTIETEGGKIISLDPDNLWGSP